MSALKTKLKSLYLSNSEISDLSVVSELTELTSLYLIGSKIRTTDFLLPLTKLLVWRWRGIELRMLKEFQKLAVLRDSGALQYLSLKSSPYYVNVSILDDPVALQAYLYVPPPLTGTFRGYPKDRPTDEFTLTIEFSEPVTGFQKEDIIVETKLTTGTGVAT